MTIFASKKFWLDSSERAIKTFAQSAVAMLTAEYTGILEIDIVSLLSVSSFAALVSILTRVAGAGEKNVDNHLEYINEVDNRKLEKIEASETTDEHNDYVDYVEPDFEDEIKDMGGVS